MLRSSAGNFYNYFRPGAGEESSLGRLSRGASSRPPTPPPLPDLFLDRPLTTGLLFFSSLLYLHHHLAFLTTHGPFVVHRPFLSVPPLFFSIRLAAPLPVARSPARFSYPFLCLARYCSERGVVHAGELSREQPARRVSKHLGRISPALISLVRHCGNYRSAPVRSRSVATANLCISRATLPPE